jgi:alpha-galactosidase
MKLALIGAGSAVFARTFILDLLLSRLEGLEIALVDPEEARLALTLKVGEALLDRFPKKGFTLRPSAMGPALKGADVALLVADVGGEEALRRDYEIPLAFGVDQSIGDTLGPGGLMKFLRLFALMEEVAAGFSGELVLNYMNPLSPVTAYFLRRGLRALGLCHSVPETARTLAEYLGVDGLEYRALGVNHLAFFLELRHQGEDLYPRLKALAQDLEVWEKDPVRFEVLRVFGLFPSESSGHLSEYLPYFRKRPEVLRRYARPGYRGESGFYARHHARFVEEAREQAEAWLRGEGTWERSGEYASRILEAYFSGGEEEVYATVANEGLVPELLPFVAEVPLRVKERRLEPQGGHLPPGPAALARRMQEVQALWLEGVLQGDVGLLIQGLALDPLTGAVLDLRGVEALFAELARSHGELMPPFVRKAVHA